MINIVFETPENERLCIEVDAQGTLMEAAQAHDIPGILADCGGAMVCGTCHVVIESTWNSALPEQCQMEIEILKYVPEPQLNSRLSCQIPLTNALDGLVVRIPAQQR